MSGGQYLEKSVDSLKDLRSQVLLDPEGDLAIESELNSLEEMIEKLEGGVVEIAVFGEVSSGKSSLLNALLGSAAFETGARNGVTTIKDKKEWKLVTHTSKGLGDSRVVLVDTPGINEVDGEARSIIARDTIRDSDLIIFVVKSDLNDTEYQAIKELNDLNKPIVVAFNKVDIYTREQRATIYEAVRNKLKGIVNPENIVFTAGDPIEREVLIQSPDGFENTVWRKPKSIIDDLQSLILDILNKEGKAIVALNAALFASGISDRIAAKKVAYRREYAETLIGKYAALKGASIALNPIPFADIMGGVAVDTCMVVSIGKVYGIKVGVSGSQSVMMEIGKSMAVLGCVEMATHIVANLFKISTFGLGTIVVGLPQGAVAAWGSYVVGSACHEYFANGASWGENGPKAVVREILANADRASVMGEIKKGIKDLLKDKSTIKKVLKEEKIAAGAQS